MEKNDGAKKELLAFANSFTEEKKVEFFSVPYIVSTIALLGTGVSMPILPEAIFLTLPIAIAALLGLLYFGYFDLRFRPRDSQDETEITEESEFIDTVSNALRPVPGYSWKITHQGNDELFVMLVSDMEKESFALGYEINRRNLSLCSRPKDQKHPQSKTTLRTKFNSMEDLLQYATQLTHEFLMETSYLTHLPQRTPVRRNGKRSDFTVEIKGNELVIQRGHRFTIPDASEIEKREFIFYAAWTVWTVMHMLAYQSRREKVGIEKKRMLEERTIHEQNVEDRNNRVLDSVTLKTPLDDSDRV